MLWPDTFNNYFQPEIAIAATEALEELGFRVILPRQVLCCGRPLYEYGMIDVAKRKLAKIVESLRSEVRAGTPVIGLEPSCVSTFRDELPNLFPLDEDARRLSQQTVTLGEFLSQHADDLDLPRFAGRAIVHFHCHHRATMSLGSDEDILRRLGLDYRVLDSGCCGMAGAFGFEKKKL